MDHWPDAGEKPIATRNDLQQGKRVVPTLPYRMLPTTPPCPPPKITSIIMFQAPHGAERVIPGTTDPGMEKVELITSGRVYFDSSGGEILAHPGAVFWHLPGERTVHRYPPGGSYECLCINFLCESKPRRIVPRYTHWVDVPSAQAFAREIVDCVANGQLADPAFGAYVYHRLFWNALTHGTRAKHAGPSHLADACAFIRSNIAEDLPVEKIARTIGISGPHLHHLFRLHLARTPHGFILEERFQKACKLLRGTRLQSKEIAYRCGFRDAAEFSRTFRRLAGCAPREYRVPTPEKTSTHPARGRKTTGQTA